MEWTIEQQVLFDTLRARQLAGTLTTEEQSCLAELTAQLEAEEARYLAPATARMRLEQAALREQLAALQNENEALSRLMHQQEQLAADARQWLAQFEQRRQQIQQTYMRITGQALAASGTL